MSNVKLAAIAAVLAAAAVPARAEQPRHDFYAKGGVFFNSVDSSIRIDANNVNIGSEIDFENDLGLPSKTTLPFGLVGWRFSDNWRVEGEFFTLSRTRTKTIDRNITFGDVTYPVNGSVTAGLKTNIYRLVVGYSFVNRPDLEIGADFGAHLSNFSTFIEGVGSVAGATSALRREERSQLVPLPTVGVYGRYKLNDIFALVGRVDYFQLKISDYKGNLVDASAGVTARLTDHIGIGADFRYVDYGLRATATDFTGNVDYTFYGPFLYLTLGF